VFDVTVAVKVTGWSTEDGDGNAATLVVVEVELTTWSAVPALAVKLESPLYVAVMT
jgi:hypothetical protein